MPTLKNLNEKNKSLKNKLLKLTQNKISKSHLPIKIIKFITKNPTSTKPPVAEIGIGKFARH